jgi:hypothetical protein
MADSVEAAWAEYRDAVSAVFPEASGEGLQLLAGATTANTSDESLQAIVDRSDMLGEAIVASEPAEADDETKELTQLKLLAASAIDLDHANRLAALADEDGENEARVELLQAFGPPLAGPFLTRDELAQLETIITTPPERASEVLDGAPKHVFSLLATTTAPVDAEALEKAVDDAIDSIVSDSSAFAAKTLSGLVGIGSDKILEAVGKGVDTVFGHLAKGLKRIAKHAAKLVWNAIKKLLAIFGKDADKLLKKVADWVVGLDADHIGRLLGGIFSVDALKKQLRDDIDARGGHAGSDLADASSGVTALAGHLHKQLSILGKIGWLLQKTQGFFIHKVDPWGTLAAVVIWVAGIGYAIDVAEDYLDWGEGRILDRVAGVKRIVESHLAAASHP